MKLFGDLDLNQGVLKQTLFETVIDFPPSPNPGQVVFKDKKVYVCTDFAGNPTWVPLTNEIDIRVHTQIVPATVWDIPYTLANKDVFVQVFDNAGNQVFPGNIDLSVNGYVRITFGADQTGRAVLVHRIGEVPTFENYAIQPLDATLTTLANLDTQADRIPYFTGVDTASTTPITAFARDLISAGDAVTVRSLLAAASAADVATLTAAVSQMGSSAEIVALQSAIAALQTEALTFAPQATTYTKTEVDSAIASATPSFSTLSGKPTTVAGYGITDAYTKTETDSAIAASAGGLTKDFSSKNLTVAGDILPTTNGVQNIGSATQRFASIFVNEARLSANTLYIGDTPILGTAQDTISFKADPNQSINIQTRGTGSTLVTSEKGVTLETTGLNADVIIQAGGTGSKIRVGAAQTVDITAPELTVYGNSTVTGNQHISGNLALTGNLTFSGAATTINATTVTTSDNIIVLNNGEVGSGVTAGKAGLQVDRGDQADYQILFDETDDLFKVGMVNQLEAIASRPWVASNFADIGHIGSGAGAHAVATTAVNGFMSSTDKAKLDGIVTGASVSSVAGRAGAVVLTKADVGLSNVDNIADGYKNVASAAVLTTAHNIAGVSFNGSVDIAIPFANLASKPTTIAGYSISDAYTKSQVDGAIAGAIPTFSTLTGKPTTVAGYGITDVYTKAQVDSVVTSSTPTFASLTGKPTTITGYGIAIVASDIPALDWSKINTGKPTTVAGYGITIAAADVPNLDWSKINTGKPTTLSGYGVATSTQGSDGPVTISALTAEIGRYLDFHGVAGEAADYTVRLDGGANGSTTLTLTGSLTASGNVTAYSDERLKTNWRDLTDNFVGKLAAVKVGVYDRIDTGETQVGISAQSLQEVLPEAVVTSDSGVLGVVYGNAALAACIELAKEVVALRAEIEALKAK